ncbi:MAG: UDP-N-acetylglucosamine 2-epimerase (non-hydrolyzing) [Ktedonobacterales bacterium]|nr:UDP-N-acetylglucosamine 2-epimerase (non-hydrolyzing) [Ktedonobacterales bacterium]
MKVATAVGARPQFIKLAPVSRALRQRHQEVIIHTGQHYDDRMSATFFAEMAIPTPDYHLGIGSGPHGAQTGQMLAAIEEVLLKERPDVVVVFGDTNSTLAAALAAAKLHIPVAHVEAGLRSFNREMPEEINRVLTDHVSAQLYCPTETAVRHLQREGVIRGVEQVGDVMFDVLLEAQPRIQQRAQALLPEFGLTPRGYILATIHRPANTDDPEAMRRIGQAFSDFGLPVLFPVHPRTRKLLERYGIAWSERIRFVEPLGHLDLLALASQAHQVATDSGGVQKEAFLLATPCTTLREETEWPETLEGDWNTLTGSRDAAICKALGRPRPAQLRHNPFGKGDAASRIAQSLHA